MAPMAKQLTLLDPPPALAREVALARLDALVGADLRPLADDHGITVWREGKRNKGWAGQTVERLLGQRPNSIQAADFGDWELKVVPLALTADGQLRLKETMAITMFTEADLETQAFEESHLLAKLERIVVVGRVYEDATESRSLVAMVVPFDLSDPALREQVRADYDEIRWVVRQHGAYALDARLGRLVQPRPKGAGQFRGGHGFYARKAFVEHMLGLPT